MSEVVVRLEVSHTSSYSLLTKLAKLLNQKCPKPSQIELLPVALSRSKVPHYLVDLYSFTSCSWALPY